MTFLPGTVVGERYKLDSLIGAGGMGTVWAAVHTITHKPVALKFLRDEQGSSGTLRQRFLREARAACAVRHPNVVEIHDVFETNDGTPLMVMELLEGETLASRLRREKTLSVQETARICLPIVSAVGMAHSLGIVHRDLKPENVFLVKTSEEGRVFVKVLDFGIAKLTALEGIAASTSALTADGGMLGTPYYMSPEQADGEKDIDHRSDIWSLGIILYECLSGTMPTQGENLGQVFKSITRGTFAPLTELVPGLPAEVGTLVSQMLARDRRRRPESMRDVAAILQHYSDTPTGRFDDPSPVVRPTQPGAPSTGGGRGPVMTPVSPLASSLGEAQTMIAATQSVVSREGRRRRAGSFWILGAGIVALWLGISGARALLRKPAAGVAAAASGTPKLPAAAPAPSSVPSEVPSGAPVASAVARDAGPGTPAPGPVVKAARPKPAPAATASSVPVSPPAPSSPARPGGIYEKAPF